MTNSNKKKTVDKLLRKFKKDAEKKGQTIKFGKASDVLRKREFIPFESDALNAFIGEGEFMGVPRGQVTAIGGHPMSGKSRLCLGLIQRLHNEDKDSYALWIDAERNLDEDVLNQYPDIDPDRFLILDEGDAEDLLDQAIDILEEKVVDVVVLDSIAALAPKGELEDTGGRARGMSDNQVALQARVMSKFCRIAVGSGAISKSQAAFIAIAQVRTDINAYGAPLNVVGGNAIKHYSRLILAVRRGQITDDYKEKLKKGDNKEYTRIKGFPCNIKITKTSFGINESKETIIPFYFSDGFDDIRSRVSDAIRAGIIERSGAWFSSSVFPEGRIQGKAATYDFFKKNPEALERIEKNEISETEEASEQ